MRSLILCLFLGLFGFTGFLFSQEKLVVGNIELQGNELTKPQVIYREIPIQLGDSIDTSEIAEIKALIIQNLTNTRLFNFIEVETREGSGEVSWVVKMEERWYIWPSILFQLAETNFNSWWENKDFERINYGFSVAHYNFRGRREKLTLNFQYGWKRKIGLNYSIPGINKKRTIGGGLEVYYANNREINFASLDNQREFFKRDRFLQEELSGVARVEIRPRFFNTQTVRFGYRAVWIDDTVTNLFGEYLEQDATQSQYLLLSYGFRREKRDNNAYPLSGYILDGVVEQEGFGLLRKDDIMLTSTKWTFNMHHPLSNRWFFGHGLKTKYTIFGDPPYYNQRALGYSNNFIRGYELKVIDGQHYLLYKSNIKYQLIKKRTMDLFNYGFLRKFDKFHYSLFLNLFGDAGYVTDNINAAVNPLANTLQYGYGIGLDLVTYYDMVIRFEGSINRQGIPGFYIHFKNPI